MEEGKEIVSQVEAQVPEVVKEKPKELSTVQSRMEELIPFAGTIETTEEQKKILFAPVKSEDVEIRPDGLVYLPWMEYVRRLRDAFGVGWAIIPKDMPKLQSNHMYWPFYLMIQGKLAGFAIGEQEYQPNNRNMSYSDASEGAKSNALMRLCKGIGISLELWKPSFIRAWKAKYAETYKDEGKVKWRRKVNPIGVEEAGEVVEEVYCSTGEPTPLASSLPIITIPIDNVTKRDGGKDDKKFTIYTIHAGEHKITTFSETFAKTAKEFMAKKEEAVIEYKQTKYGMELVSITKAEEIAGEGDNDGR